MSKADQSHSLAVMAVTERNNKVWPPRPSPFPDLMNPTEAAQYLRLDEGKHTPKSARRTLDYWRWKGKLRATKYGKRVWFLQSELDEFLHRKTEEWKE